jgi:hypothetical protein
MVDYILDQKEEHGSSGGKAFVANLKNAPLTIPMILMGIACSLFLTLLCIYHGKLLLQGRTTNEDLKEPGYNIRPYDRLSWYENCVINFCVPWQKAKLNPKQPYIEPKIIYPTKKSRSEMLS